MSKNIRTLYLYIVSLIALAMIVGGFISTVNAIATYKYPNVYYYDYTYDYDDDYYDYDDDDYDDYDEYKKNNYKTYDANKDYDYQTKEGYIKKKDSVQRESLRTICSSLAVVVVGVPLFIYHWGKAENERKAKGV